MRQKYVTFELSDLFILLIDVGKVVIWLYCGVYINDGYMCKCKQKLAVRKTKKLLITSSASAYQPTFQSMFLIACVITVTTIPAGRVFGIVGTKLTNA